MQSLLVFIFCCAWFWSVYLGFRVSILCMVANFITPPFSQTFFALFEPIMRAPAVIMNVSLFMLYILY